jgi:hypothetical protein
LWFQKDRAEQQGTSAPLPAWSSTSAMTSSRCSTPLHPTGEKADLNERFRDDPKAIALYLTKSLAKK